MNRTISNRYELLEIIGEGGMNTVYKAEDTKTGELVAIKILKREFNEDEDVIKRFHMESEAIQQLEHENIVKVLDVGVDGTDHYLVMELLKLKTLKDVVTETKIYFNNEDIINMSLQILKGIKVAHDNKIIHRDIKPQNILIDENGVLKVSDFGIARVATSDTMKNTKDAIGSVHYASPEQSRGSVVDERSDIYSFGILLYELSTGRLPFEGDTAISIALKHTRGDIVEPKHLNLNLNPSIAQIIKKCIQRDSARRFESVSEIISLFEALKQNPNEPLSDDYKELIIPPADTINMNGIAPFLDGEKEEKNKVQVSEVKQKFNLVPMIVTVASAFLVGIMILFLIFWRSGKELDAVKPFELPDVVGKNFTEASEMLIGKRLNVEKTDAVFDDKIPENAIISQIPKAGATVKEGQTVKVVVSLGKDEKIVPKLVGETLEQARVNARNAGLEIKVEKEFNEKKQGTVIKQDPKEGKPAPEGIVTLTVSLGEEAGMQIMPELVKKTRDYAVNSLKELKLVVGVIEPIYDDNIAEGEITWQSVIAGAEVSEGTVINMKVSLGKKPAENKKDQPSGPVSVDENPEQPSENKDDPNKEKPDNLEGEQVATSYFIPLKQDKEQYAVKVIKSVDGNEQVLYDHVHQSSEGSVKIDVIGKGHMILKFYIDDELFDEKEVDL